MRSMICSKCGYDMRMAKTLGRQALATCDVCGTFCCTCLVEMAIEHGGMSPDEAIHITIDLGADGFIGEEPITGRRLCCACLRREQR